MQAAALAAADRKRQALQKRLKPEERRAQLIEATLSSLARHGAQGASLRQVCRDLRVSPSLVNYFFGGWNDLLVRAYRRLAERAALEYRDIAGAGGVPVRERLRMLIERNVSQDWLSDEVVGAYLALWDLSRSVPALKAEFTRFHRTRRRLVAGLFSEAGGAGRARQELDLLAAGFVVLLDGFWLELGLNAGNIPRRRAVEMCWLWVEQNLPERPARGEGR
jgi:TetR/AcrR family transcriptional repressor of bet genes